MTATPSDDPPVRDGVGESPPAKPKLRGLWTVMQPAETAVEAHSPPVSKQEARSEPATTSTNDAAAVKDQEIPATRGLWSLMRAPTPAAASKEVADADDLVPMEIVEPVEVHVDDVERETEPVEAALEIATELPAADSLGEEFEFGNDEISRPASRGWQVLWLGLIALPLAATAWFGLLWTALFTAVCGFGALILAAVEWTTTGPVHRGKRTKVIIGAAAGTLALILGPYVFGPLGNAAREARSGRNTQRHLQQIGTALLQFHEKSNEFPAGGTLLRDAEGRSRGGHSWMASTLPFLGVKTLFQQIDFSQPYDEPVNRVAMSTPVIMFFAAGGNRAMNGGGFAVTHFAGVGGDIASGRGEKQAAGIFRNGNPLTKEDVTDGLSATFAAGEIGGQYPAWGDPENLRVPQLGLNKDARGFGNAVRTGANMLFADGHVKFFPNATDPEVLRRLSTRNAGDLTSGVQ